MCICRCARLCVCVSVCPPSIYPFICLSVCQCVSVGVQDCVSVCLYVRRPCVYLRICMFVGPPVSISLSTSNSNIITQITQIKHIHIQIDPPKTDTCPSTIKADSKFTYFGTNFVKRVRRFDLLLQIKTSHVSQNSPQSKSIYYQF